jgi:hypothetical protein
MEEQLHAMSMDTPAGGVKKGAPKANQQATLLAQGLKSDDKALINVSTSITQNIRSCPFSG